MADALDGVSSARASNRWSPARDREGEPAPGDPASERRPRRESAAMAEAVRQNSSPTRDEAPEAATAAGRAPAPRADTRGRLKTKLPASAGGSRMRWVLVRAAAACAHRRRLLVRHRRPDHVDRRRLCRSREGRRLDRRVGHRAGCRREGQPARRRRTGALPARSAPVPDRARQRQGQSGADRAVDRRDEAGLQAHAERRRRASRRRSISIRPTTIATTCCCTAAPFPRPFSIRRNTRSATTRASSNRCASKRRCSSPSSAAIRTSRPRSIRNICRRRRRSTRRNASSIIRSSRRRSPAS